MVTGLYGLGYAVSAIKQSTVWMALMRPVNIGMSLLIAIIALLAHTPVLDPLGWSARNQYRRLVQEKVDAEAFDYGSMRFHLGRAGYARLLTLGQLADHPQAEIIHKQVEMVREAKSYSAWEKTRSPVITADHLNVFTPSGHLPEGLVEKLTFDLYGYLIKGCMEKKDCLVFSINLDMDQDSEYAFVTSGKWYAILLYDRDENLQWQRVGNFRFKGGKRPNRAAFIEAIEQSKTIVMQPRYGDLQIANWVLYLGQE